MSAINFNWFSNILKTDSTQNTSSANQNNNYDFSNDASIFGNTANNTSNDYSFDSFTSTSNASAQNNDYRNSAISNIDSATKKELGDDCYSSTSTLGQLSTEDLTKMQKYMSQGTRAMNLNGTDTDDIKNKLQTADQNALMTTPDKDGKTLTEKFIEAYKEANNGQDPQVKDENGSSPYDNFYWSENPQAEIDKLKSGNKAETAEKTSDASSIATTTPSETAAKTSDASSVATTTPSTETTKPAETTANTAPATTEAKTTQKSGIMVNGKDFAELSKDEKKEAITAFQNQVDQAKEKSSDPRVIKAYQATLNKAQQYMD